MSMIVLSYPADGVSHLNVSFSSSLSMAASSLYKALVPSHVVL